MTIESFLQVLRVQPFRPFVMHLADRRKIDVRHPEFVARSPAGRTVIIYQEGEHFEIVDLLLVASLKTVNGARRPRKGR